jgi:hypothetical protein
MYSLAGAEPYVKVMARRLPEDTGVVKGLPSGVVQVRVAQRTVGFLPQPPPGHPLAARMAGQSGYHLILSINANSLGAKTRELESWCGLRGRMYLVTDDGSLEICESCQQYAHGPDG